jgi:hypothetical protein
MKLGAQAIRPLAANVMRAPPTNTQMSVGVRSTNTDASRKSSNAVVATSPASAVRFIATGTSRQTVHANPIVANTPNTAASISEGTPSNNASTPPAAAPTSPSTSSGLR